MSSVYEKLLDTSHNPPSTNHQRQRLEKTLSSHENDQKQQQQQREGGKRGETKEPDYFDKTGNEDIFVRSEPDLAYSDTNFQPKNKNEPVEQRLSNIGKLA